MDISIRRIRILFKKDFLDFFKNMAVSLGCLMPIIFAIIYKYLFSGLEIGGGFILNLILCLNLSMICVMLPATTLAEEKEKFTLRTLMLSNVSGFEVFTAKLLVTSVFLLISNIIIYLIAGVGMASLPLYILITFVGAIPMILIGAIVGIVSRDQMNASVYEIPAMLLFMLPVIFGGLNKTVETIAAFTPSQPVLGLVTNLLDGKLMSSASLESVGVILVWLVIASAALGFLYKKRGLDN